MCNASDTAGRYTYSKQPEVCKWNLQKLAEALDPALPLELAEAILAEEFDTEFGRHYLQKMRRKLGLVQTEQEGDGALVAQLLETMHLTGEWGQVAHELRLSGSPSPVLQDCLCRACVTSWPIQLGGPVLPRGDGRLTRLLPSGLKASRHALCSGARSKDKPRTKLPLFFFSVFTQNL